MHFATLVDYMQFSKVQEFKKKLTRTDVGCNSISRSFLTERVELSYEGLDLTLGVGEAENSEDVDEEVRLDHAAVAALVVAAERLPVL